LKRDRHLTSKLLEPYGGRLSQLMSACRQGEVSDRMDALMAVGQLEFRGAASTVWSLMLDPAEDIRVRREAADALVSIASDRIIRRIIRLLQHGRTAIERELAAYALLWSHDKRATPELLAVVENQNEEVQVRAQAAEALANCGTEEAVVHLITALRDAEPLVRFWAAFALGELGDQRAVPELSRLAREDMSPVPYFWAHTVAAEARDAVRSIRRYHRQNRDSGQTEAVTQAADTGSRITVSHQAAN
jgi:HEAT repeat protein